MSIATCEKCDRYVDTDEGPGYYEFASYTNQAHPVNPAFKERTEWICLCEWCAEEYVDEDGFYHPKGVPS